MGCSVKVRVVETPIEREMDGVKLDRLTPGRVCIVSTSLGSWLLAEGYAELEMRAVPAIEDQDPAARSEERGSSVKPARHHVAADRRQRAR
jgi:hypothetical protein